MAERGAQKCRRMVLTLEKKLEILEKAKDKRTSSLARKYNIGISTVCDIKNSKEKLKALKLSLESSGSLKKRKIMRNVNDEELNKAG